MPKKNKVKKPKKRYFCEKCGKYAAVKHGQGRYRCLECKSIYSPNSKKTCYTKDEYLVLKAILQLYKLLMFEDSKNKRISLKKFTKIAKEQNVDDIKKLVEFNIINKIDKNERDRISKTDINDVLVLVRDNNCRFRIYKNFFAPGKKHTFKNRTIKAIGIRGGGSDEYDKKSYYGSNDFE